MFAYWVLFLSAFLVFQVVAGLFAIWAIKYMSERDMAEFAARCAHSNISDKEET